MRRRPACGGLGSVRRRCGPRRPILGVLLLGTLARAATPQAALADPVERPPGGAPSDGPLDTSLEPGDFVFGSFAVHVERPASSCHVAACSLLDDRAGLPVQRVRMVDTAGSSSPTAASVLDLQAQTWPPDLLLRLVIQVPSPVDLVGESWIRAAVTEANFYLPADALTDEPGCGVGATRETSIEASGTGDVWLRRSPASRWSYQLPQPWSTHWLEGVGRVVVHGAESTPEKPVRFALKLCFVVPLPSSGAAWPAVNWGADCIRFYEELEALR